MSHVEISLRTSLLLDPTGHAPGLQLDTNNRHASDSVLLRLQERIGGIGLKNRWMPLVCLLASTAAAQVSDYLGPGVLSRGAGDIGTRSGRQVDLRLYAGAAGVFDNQLQP